MGQDASKKEKKEAKDSTITNQSSQQVQQRQIHHVAKPKSSKEVLEQSFLHSQINYIFSYITTLSSSTSQKDFPLNEEELNDDQRRKYHLMYDVTTNSTKKVNIASKEIYKQNDTIKDIILLSDNLYITISDFRVEIWNFETEDTPKPIDLLIPMISNRISTHNYFYCLTKLSKQNFAFALKNDKTIIVCNLDSKMKVHCFLLDNKNEVIGMAPLSEWKMVTVSREGIINIWDISLQKSEKVMKDKKKKLTISFMEKLSDKLILLSDWHSPITLICDIQKNAMVKTFNTDVREVIKLSEIQYLFIGKNIYLQYDLGIGEIVGEIKNINDDINNKETKFYCGLTVDRYLFFCQANEKIYLKNVFATEENTIKALTFPASLNKIRVIKNLDEDDSINPVVILFFSRKFIVLDYNLLVSGKYQETNLYFDYMFSYQNKIYYFTKEDRKINDNKGIFLMSYPEGKVISKKDYEESRFYKLKGNNLMAICCSDCIRIMSCDTNEEIETYENIFPMNSPQDYAERYLCELKDNKLLAYSKNMYRIINIGKESKEEEESKSSDDSEEENIGNYSNLYKIEGEDNEIKQCFQYSDNKVAIFRDNYISILNLENYNIEGEIKTDKKFEQYEKLDINILGDEIIGYFNKNEFEMWDLKEKTKHTKFEELESRMKREEINILRPCQNNKSYFAVTNYSIRNNRENISILVKDNLKDKWGAIDSNKIYAFGEKNFYIFTFEQ